MTGRRVTDWARRIVGEVMRWESLGAGMCNVLVRIGTNVGDVCWYASTDLRPIDGLGPLPSRAVACEWARQIALDSLYEARAKLIAEWHKPWPGAEHGKAIVGQSIDAAIKDLETK